MLAAAGGLWLGGASNLGAQTYTFSTLAGDPSILDPNGDPIGDYADGTSRHARFNYPQAAVVDAGGSVFVADTANNCIRVIKREGSDSVVTTIAGQAGTPGADDGLGSTARFTTPLSVAVDGATNVSVADSNNHAIRMGVPPSGGPPALQIEREENQVILSWPVSAEGFVLETTGAVPAQEGWTPLTQGGGRTRQPLRPDQQPGER